MPEFHSVQGPDGSDTTRMVNKRVVFTHWDGVLEFLGFAVSEDDSVLNARKQMEFEFTLNPIRNGFRWFNYILLQLDAAGIEYELVQYFTMRAIFVQDPIGNDVWIFEENHFRFLKASERIDNEGDDKAT